MAFCSCAFTLAERKYAQLKKKHLSGAVKGCQGTFLYFVFIL